MVGNNISVTVFGVKERKKKGRVSEILLVEPGWHGTEYALHTLGIVVCSLSPTVCDAAV